MKVKNYYLIAAGGICLFTALLHAIGGQFDLVNPMMNSNLEPLTKTEWLGAWHMVTVTLFVSAYYLLRNGFKIKKNQKEVLKIISLLNLLFGFVFIMVSILNGILAPQWILLLPIGVLGLIGIKKITPQLREELNPNPSQ